MQLEGARAQLRARSHSEAGDLGILLLRDLWRPAAAAWLIFVLPLQVCIVMACSGIEEGWVYFALWWLKPVYARAWGVVLGQGLFGSPPTGLGLWRALWQQGRRGLFGDLLWRRPDPARTIFLPVTLLEGLVGAGARRRRRNLVEGHTASLWSAMTSCLLIEFAVFCGLVAGGAMLLPDEIAGYENVFGLRDWGGDRSYALIAAYAAAIAVAEPLFIASGFGLYINRRTTLEGWDVELTFRRMAQRLASASTAALLLLVVGAFGFGGLGTLGVGNAHAQDDEGAGDMSDLVDPDELASEPRWTEDPALAGDTDLADLIDALETGDAGVSDAGIGDIDIADIQSRGAATDEWRLPVPAVATDDLAAQAMERVLARPELKRSHVEEHWELRVTPGEDEEPPQWLLDLAESIAVSVEIVLWVIAMLVLAALIYVLVERTRQLRRDPVRARPLPSFVNAIGHGVARERVAPHEVAPRALALLADGRHADALAALYVGALTALLVDDGIEVRPQATEGECLRVVAASAVSAVRGTLFADLTQLWQFVAYAHTAPTAGQVEDLCGRFAQSFGAAR